MIVALLRNVLSWLAAAAIAIGVILLFIGVFSGILLSTEPLDQFGQQPGLSADAKLVTFAGGVSALLIGAVLLFGRSQIGGFNGSR